MDEIEKLVADDPGATAYYAVTEMHYGRLDWLAVHIRRCDYQISPAVARKILAMLEGSDTNCRFQLKAVRNSELPPNARDKTQTASRDAELALEVARIGGFERGQISRACFEVGKRHGLSPEYVKKRIRPFRDMAILRVAEEAEAHWHGEVDILGRPKHP